MKSWGLALISLGCISIMSGPMLMKNYIGMIVQGIVLIVVGIILIRKK